MKTGILTFIHTSNYGAVLQAYAMQTLLNDLGADNEFIDYHCPSVLKNHSIKHMWRRKGIKNKLAVPLLSCVYGKRLRKFARFEKKYLKISDNKYNRENIGESVLAYGRFIVGSDQVWNPALTEGDMTFFLDFIKNKDVKLSYAVSVGMADFPGEYKEKCYNLVKGFGKVNVREETARETLRSKGIEADCVLDPTLMIDSEHWRSFVGERPHKKKYILMCMSPSDDESIRRIQEYAKARDCELFQVKKGIRHRKGFKILNTLSPSEYLTWLYHAELVISGSFHGVCFSVLFEKPFWAFYSPSKNLTGRIDNLLSQLSLSDRKYSADAGLPSDKVDFAPSRQRLRELRYESAEILRQTLQMR